VLTGALTLNKFLISFELLLIATAPNILFLFGLNTWRYLRFHQTVDLALVGAWLGLGLILAAYFLYFAAGLTHVFWQRGLWFSENDLLQIGLIAWMVYLAAVVGQLLQDAPQSPPAAPPAGFQQRSVS
jgi:hypothetical protein